MRNEVLIIMPVKDSLETAEQAIRAIVESGYVLTVYNDYSSPENTERLHLLSQETGIEVIDIANLTDHPSPNYRYVLLDSRRKAIEAEVPLIIVESDVVVTKDTIQKLLDAQQEGVGMIAAVTHNEAGEINFPYEYAQKWTIGAIETKKRFSFCCTLLTPTLLRAMDWETLLDPNKNWYDVTISHESSRLGFRNILLTNTPVVHKPHSSRPWKQLKYTHPLLYYWRKLTQHKDKI